jgi:hypothetical protein
LPSPTSRRMALSSHWQWSYKLNTAENTQNQQNKQGVRSELSSDDGLITSFDWFKREFLTSLEIFARRNRKPGLRDEREANGETYPLGLHRFSSSFLDRPRELPLRPKGRPPSEELWLPMVSSRWKIWYRCWEFRLCVCQASCTALVDGSRKMRNNCVKLYQHWYGKTWSVLFLPTSTVLIGTVPGTGTSTEGKLIGWSLSRQEALKFMLVTVEPVEPKKASASLLMCATYIYARNRCDIEAGIHYFYILWPCWLFIIRTIRWLRVWAFGKAVYETLCTYW